MGRRRDSGESFSEDLPDGDATVDISAVRRDDALIDAISGNGLVETESTEEYELATLLAGWRAEILSDPVPAGPDLDQVVAAVHRELGARDTLASRRERSSRQLRVIRPIAGAAALVAVALGGAAAVSYSAEPGDPLWGVKQVVFSERAHSTEARIDTTTTLERAEQLIADGKANEAQQLLASAEARSSAVTDSADRDALGEWLQRLSAEIEKLAQPVPPPPPPPGPAEVPAPDAGQLPPVLPPPVVPAPLPGTTQPVEPSPAPAPPSPSPIDPTILDAPPASDTVSPTPTPTPTPTPPASQPGTGSGSTEPPSGTPGDASSQQPTTPASASISQTTANSETE
ncbi:anti-sigma-D factor RsdA [Rhodococcus coprophilus]|uniref:anti-sigma-D factor RsdA n=1 Tax=Rhodococcus coprophilus TaxID=38310 RepID=UPI0037B4E01E